MHGDRRFEPARDRVYGHRRRDGCARIAPRSSYAQRRETAISTADVELFLGILALVANVTVAGAVLVPPFRRWLAAQIGAQALVAAWIVSLVAMSGSLYFSEVANFTPCNLCWYQRIAMYPLVALLGIAAWKGDWGIRPYVWTIAGIGAVISTYHYQLERFPQQHAVACSKELPCSLVWFEQFGFITISYMALSAFLLIITLLWLGGPLREPVESGEPRRVAVEA